MIKLGIIGCGFVGGAVAQGFSIHADLKIYDKFKTGFDSFDDVVKQDVLFLCLPTPMRADGSQNQDALLEAVTAIDGATDCKKIIVIKSTVVPGTTRKFAKEFPNHRFVMNPEFLTARSARLDFINSARIIVGGDSIPRSVVSSLYRERFPTTPIFETTWEGAEIVKYMTNCFFALKISYLNEIYDICQKFDIPYNEMRNMWLADGRIGNSHADVPGHDGDRGFGGTCFPKDVNAFAKWAREEMESPLLTLEAALAVNRRVRQKKDWEVT